MYYATEIDYKSTENNAFYYCVLFTTSELIEQKKAFWLPTDGYNLMCLQVIPHFEEVNDCITFFERNTWYSLYTTEELEEIDNLLTNLKERISTYTDFELSECFEKFSDFADRSIKYDAYRDLIETAESELGIAKKDIIIPFGNCFKNGEKRSMNGDDFIAAGKPPYYVAFYNTKYTDFGTVGMSLRHTLNKFDNLAQDEMPSFDEDGLLFSIYIASYTKNLQECEKFINNLNHKIYTPEEIVTLRNEFNRIKENGDDEWYLDNNNNCETLIYLLDRQSEYEATMKLLRSAEKLGMPEEILWVECYRPELKDNVIIHANEYKQLYQSDKAKNKEKIQKEK